MAINVLAVAIFYILRIVIISKIDNLVVCHAANEASWVECRDRREDVKKQTY